MKKKLLFFSILLIASTAAVFSQSLKNNRNYYEPLPNGYKNIFLGMTVDETKQALLRNPDFGYHGERDVSLMPGTREVLIETNAASKFSVSFLTRSWFQFYNDNLYIMTVNFNQDKMDYYSIFTTLCEKYGEPKSLNPQKATWENSEITMILEKPLSIKYIDNKIYNELSNYSNISKSAEEDVRQMFLDEF